ncbi:MAG TPA: DUF4340 domain-containing protein, partial [Steroidobacteraceae bacterium]|nr:DUF4340 domain-containing protein [Steroidobacteraceae bacterium]
MMTQRRVVVLLAAAVVVIGGAVWVSSQRHLDRDTTAGQPVLEGLKAALNDVTEIRVTKGDGTHATLRKRPTDWAVVERSYPADSGKVRKLLLDLGALEVVEEKTRDPANFARIGVDEVNSPKATGTRVEAVTPKKVYGLIVGNTSGSKSVYVRAAGAQQSLLATPGVTADSDPKRWLDHTLVDIPEARIKEVALAPAGSTAYTVSREKKEQTDFTVSNIPKGRELSSPGAGNPMAGDLASVTLDDVRSSATAPAATAPADRVTFRTFDGLELQVDGRKEGDHHF